MGSFQGDNGKTKAMGSGSAALLDLTGNFLMTLTFTKAAAQVCALLAPAAIFVAAPAAASAPAPDIDTVEASKVQTNAGDPQFRALFATWKRLDQIDQGTVSIPSANPVKDFRFTSAFGVRSDPFRRRAAMHAGIDLAGPVGTPIYATADGIVSFSGWMNGYGNLIEIAHGQSIDTRYGHLSKILVSNNSRVKRGQIIGLMGSTGRSTGSHLHYEVRIDSRAVNPLPFMQSSDYLLAMQARVGTDGLALGGPDDE